ncbi:Zona pellucida domain [Trinorchestia longiramus]|nr:Zona pellucida domain [Trinorchestia longiramus]
MKLLLLLCFLLKVVASQLPPAGGAMMNMATITDLDVICDKSGMTVTVDFSQPFNGIIFSKGYYADPGCRYVEENSGQTSFTMWISSTECGSVMEQVPEDASRTELSNTLIVQNDKYIQEIWDVARTITCDWVDNYVKTVNFNPFSVGMLQSQEVKFQGDQPVECWMDLQQGKWPDIRDINSIVKIGDALSLLVYVRDNDGQYDVSAKDCYAFAGPDFENPATPRLQLTDEEGCVLKHKLISPFYTDREDDRSGSVIVTYAIVNAFKFPDVMDVFMTCNVEICKGECDNKCSVVPTEAPRRSGSTLFGEPIYTTKAKPFCPPGSTNPECPLATTPFPFLCIPGSKDPKCPQITLPAPKPICYPGSTDPVCRKDSPNRGKSLFPLANQCIPGINDPNCLSNPNIPKTTLPRCYHGSLDPSCKTTTPKTTELLTTTTIELKTTTTELSTTTELKTTTTELPTSTKTTDFKTTTTELPTTTTQKCYPGSLDPDCEPVTKGRRFGSILFPVTITTLPTTTTRELTSPVTVPVTTTFKPKTTKRRSGGVIFGGPITTPKPFPPRPSLKPKTTTTKSPNRGKQLGEPQSKPEPTGSEWEVVQKPLHDPRLEQILVEPVQDRLSVAQLTVHTLVAERPPFAQLLKQIPVEDLLAPISVVRTILRMSVVEQPQFAQQLKQIPAEDLLAQISVVHTILRTSVAEQPQLAQQLKQIPAENRLARISVVHTILCTSVAEQPQFARQQKQIPAEDLLAQINVVHTILHTSVVQKPLHDPQLEPILVEPVQDRLSVAQLTVHIQVAERPQFAQRLKQILAEDLLAQISVVHTILRTSVAEQPQFARQLKQILAEDLLAQISVVRTIRHISVAEQPQFAQQLKPIPAEDLLAQINVVRTILHTSVVQKPLHDPRLEPILVEPVQDRLSVAQLTVHTLVAKQPQFAQRLKQILAEDLLAQISVVHTILRTSVAEQPQFAQQLKPIPAEDLLAQINVVRTILHTSVVQKPLHDPRLEPILVEPVQDRLSVAQLTVHTLVAEQPQFAQRLKQILAEDLLAQISVVHTILRTSVAEQPQFARQLKQIPAEDLLAQINVVRTILHTSVVQKPLHDPRLEPILVEPVQDRLSVAQLTVHTLVAEQPQFAQRLKQILAEDLLAQISVVHTILRTSVAEQPQFARQLKQIPAEDLLAQISVDRLSVAQLTVHTLVAERPQFAQLLKQILVEDFLAQISVVRTILRTSVVEQPQFAQQLKQITAEDLQAQISVVHTILRTSVAEQPQLAQQLKPIPAKDLLAQISVVHTILRTSVAEQPQFDRQLKPIPAEDFLAQISVVHTILHISVVGKPLHDPRLEPILVEPVQDRLSVAQLIVHTLVAERPLFAQLLKWIPAEDLLAQISVVHLVLRTSVAEQPQFAQRLRQIFVVLVQDQVIVVLKIQLTEVVGKLRHSSQRNMICVKPLLGQVHVVDLIQRILAVSPMKLRHHQILVIFIQDRLSAVSCIQPIRVVPLQLLIRRILILVLDSLGAMSAVQHNSLIPVANQEQQPQPKRILALKTLVLLSVASQILFIPVAELQSVKRIQVLPGSSKCCTANPLHASCSAPQESPCKGSNDRRPQCRKNLDPSSTPFPNLENHAFHSWQYQRPLRKRLPYGARLSSELISNLKKHSRKRRDLRDSRISNLVKTVAVQAILRVDEPSSEKATNKIDRYVEHNSGRRSYGFRISLDTCGTAVEEGDNVSLYNTIVVQFDPLVQEVWDTARRLSCSWRNNYSKQVNFKPLSVAMLDVIRTDFKGEPFNCWMDIQRGVYPNTSPLDDVLPIGEDVSVMVFLEDKENRMDVAVRDCWALPSDDFDDQTLPRVQLTSDDGCPMKEKLISDWQSRYEESRSTLVTYSKLSAFKFPDYPQIYLTCNVEICQNECERTCDSEPSTPERVRPLTPPESILEQAECYPGSLDPECQQQFHEKWCKTFKNHPKCKKKDKPTEIICTEKSTDPQCLKQQVQGCASGSTDPKCRGQFISIDNCYPGSTDPSCIPDTPEIICYPGSNDPGCPTSKPLEKFACRPGSTDVQCQTPVVSADDCSVNPSSPKCKGNRVPDIKPLDCLRNPSDFRCSQNVQRIKCEPGSKDPSCSNSIETVPQVSLTEKTKCRPNSNDPGCSGVNVFKIPAYSIAVPDTPLQVLCSPGSTDPICSVQEQTINCILNPEKAECSVPTTATPFTKPRGCPPGATGLGCTQSHRESTFLTKPTDRPFTFVTTTPQTPIPVKCIPGITSPNCPQVVPLPIEKLVCSPGTKDPRCPEYTRIPKIPIPEIIDIPAPFCLPGSKDPRCNIQVVPDEVDDRCSRNPNDLRCQIEIRPFCEINPGDPQCSRPTPPPLNPPKPQRPFKKPSFPPKLPVPSPVTPHYSTSVLRSTTPVYSVPRIPSSTKAPRLPPPGPPTTQVPPTVPSRRTTHRFTVPKAPFQQYPPRSTSPRTFTPPRFSQRPTTPSSFFKTSEKFTTTTTVKRTSPKTTGYQYNTTPRIPFTLGTRPPLKGAPPKKIVNKVTPVYPPPLPPVQIPIDVIPFCRAGSTDPKCLGKPLTQPDCTRNPTDARCKPVRSCPPGSSKPECKFTPPSPPDICKINPNNSRCRKPVVPTIPVRPFCEERPQDPRCKFVKPKTPTKPRPQRPKEKCVNPNEPGCSPSETTRAPCYPESLDPWCYNEPQYSTTQKPTFPSRPLRPGQPKQRLPSENKNRPPIYPPRVPSSPAKPVEPNAPSITENQIPSRPRIPDTPSSTRKPPALPSKPEIVYKEPYSPVDLKRPSFPPKLSSFPPRIEEESKERSTRPPPALKPTKTILTTQKPVYTQPSLSIPIFPPKTTTQRRPPSVPEVTPSSQFEFRKISTPKPNIVPVFPPFPRKPNIPQNTNDARRPRPPKILPKVPPKVVLPVLQEEISSFESSDESPQEPTTPKPSSIPFFSIISRTTTKTYKKPTTSRPQNRVTFIRTTSRPPRLYTPSPRPTTRLPRPTTGSPPPNTQSPRSSAKQPRPTTRRPRPTTRLPRPTTRRRRPTTRLRRPTTRVVRPTTPYPRPPTSFPRPTTSFPRPTTSFPRSTTSFPRTTTSFPRPTTRQPRPSTPRPIIPTTPRPKEMMHGKDDFHGKGMDPRYHAFHSYLFKPLPRPRTRNRRELPDSSILVSVGGRKLTVVDDAQYSAGDDGNVNDKRKAPYISQNEEALVIPDKSGEPYQTYLFSDAYAFVEEVPVNDDYDFISYSSSESQNNLGISRDEISVSAVPQWNTISKGYVNFIFILSTVVIIFIAVMVVVISSKKRIKNNKKLTLEL